MRKSITRSLAVAGLFLFASMVFCQTATITGTVIDSDSVAWSGAQITMTIFNPSGGGGPIVNCATGAPITPVAIVLDAGGNFTGSPTVTRNDAICPGGTQWVFNIQPLASVPVQKIQPVSITTSTIDGGAFLSPKIVAPRFNPGGNSRGYADVEVMNPVLGSLYSNTAGATPIVHQCSVATTTACTAWVTIAPGGGGTVSGQCTSCLPLATSPTALTVSSHINEATPGQTIGTQPFTATKVMGVKDVSQAGTTPTAIASCALSATGQLCLAPVNYPCTEQYSFTTMIPSAPNNWGLIDQRPCNQFQSNFAHNWGYTRNTTFSGTPDAFADNCLLDQPPGVSGTTINDCHEVTYYRSAIGADLGNAPVGVIGGMLWATGSAIRALYQSYSSGITEGLTVAVQNNGVGDTAHSLQTLSHSGSVGTSDEGTTNDIQGGEDVNQFRETCVNGCTFGSQAISGTPTSFNLEQGDGRPVVDITQGPTTNNICGLAAGLATGLENITLCTALAGSSNAWGTLAGAVQPNAIDIFSTSYGTVLTFNINITSGTFVVDNTKPMCFANQFHDQVLLTSVSTVGSVATVTALVRRAHAGGSVVMQGPGCGTFFEIVANTTTVGSVGGSTPRYIVDFIGCTDTTHCQATFFRQGGGATTPFIANTGGFNNNLTGSSTVTHLTSTGTTMYFTGVAGGAYLQTLTTLNKFNLQFSGASDSALNVIGTACVWITSTSGTCTNSGLTGTHVATTATFQLATTTAPYSAINIWNGAEVLDVNDYTLSPPAPGSHGVLALEPNVINFTPGDTIAQLNHEAGQFNFLKVKFAAQNPFSLTSGLTLAMAGTAAQGGGNTTTSNALYQETTGSNELFYSDNGGPYIPANAHNNVGAFFTYQTETDGPSNGGNFFFDLLTTNQKNNPQYTFNLYTFGNRSGTSSVSTFTPYLGDVAYTANGELNLGGTNANVNFTTNTNGLNVMDRITATALSQPTGLTVTAGPGASSTGFADGSSQCYKLEGRNNAGFTNGSAFTEVCGTAGSNGNQNTMLVCWNRVPGATVNVGLFGRTSGSELHLIDLTTTQLCFVDDGSLTPSGALHTSNTTQPLISNMASYGVKDSGSTNQVTLVSPSLSGAVTATLPAATGTLARVATGTTASVGGGALAAGACASGTATMSPSGLVVAGSPGTAAASDGTYQAGFVINALGTASNTATVEVCAIVAGTPTAKTYNITVTAP